MFPQLKPLHPVRVIVSLLFIIGAAFHLLALRFPGISIPEPAAEHVAFSIVNFFFSVVWLHSFEKRWWAVLACGAIAGQQTIRHGVAFITTLPKVDVQSLTTVLWWWAVFTLMQLEKEQR